MLFAHTAYYQVLQLLSSALSVEMKTIYVEAWSGRIGACDPAPLSPVVYLGLMGPRIIPDIFRDA